MIVPNVIQLLPRILQSIIPFAPISLPILSLQSPIIYITEQKAAKHKRKPSPVGSSIRWIGVNCRRNDPRDISERDCPRRRDGAFIVSALVVLRPCQDEGLRDIGAGDHEEGSEVEDAGE